MNKQSTYNYIDSYLKEIQSKGRYSVTLMELKTKFDVSEKALLQNIYRLKTKNQLAQIRKEFYVIIPPQYSSRVMLPAALFINDLMEFINKDYYVSLLTAAALHGAGHQQPMEFQVITKKPSLRNIKNRKISIMFSIKEDWNNEQIMKFKTDAGYINVSTPELTAFDLVEYNKKIGGINRIIPILDELSENIKIKQFDKTAKDQRITTIQRLGFLLDEMGKVNLAKSLYKVLKNLSVDKSRKTHKKILLSLAHKNQCGTLNRKWKIIVNTDIDHS